MKLNSRQPVNTPPTVPSGFTRMEVIKQDGGWFILLMIGDVVVHILEISRDASSHCLVALAK